METSSDDVVETMTISDNYDLDFFRMHIPWHQDYVRIANSLAKYLDFESVVDLGCGCGFIIERLSELDKQAIGYDGSAYALGYSSRIRIADLTQPQDFGRHDLVICTEVAEHLAEEFADTLVDSICGASKRWVFFSAALPNSGGHLHVNEHEPEYWLEKFAAHGFALSPNKTAVIQAAIDAAIWQIYWFRNAYILERNEP